MEDREKGFDRKKRGRTSSIRYGENDSMDTDKKQKQERFVLAKRQRYGG